MAALLARGGKGGEGCKGGNTYYAPNARMIIKLEQEKREHIERIEELELQSERMKRAYPMFKEDLSLDRCRAMCS